MKKISGVCIVSGRRPMSARGCIERLAGAGSVEARYLANGGLDSEALLFSSHEAMQIG